MSRRMSVVGGLVLVWVVIFNPAPAKSYDVAKWFDWIDTPSPYTAVLCNALWYRFKAKYKKQSHLFPFLPRRVVNTLTDGNLANDEALFFGLTFQRVFYVWVQTKRTRLPGGQSPRKFRGRLMYFGYKRITAGQAEAIYRNWQK